MPQFLKPYINNHPFSESDAFVGAHDLASSVSDIITINNENTNVNDNDYS